MLKRTFNDIATRNIMINRYNELLVHFKVILRDIYSNIGKWNFSSPMKHILNKIYYAITCLSSKLYYMVVHLKVENTFFKEVLLVQIYENNRQRLFARLCSKYDTWNQFMLSGFVKTTNFSLTLYQQHSDIISQHTAFINTNCRILMDYGKVILSLSTPSVIDNTETINIAQALVSNINQSFDTSILLNIKEQSEVIISLKCMIRQLSN